MRFRDIPKFPHSAYRVDVSWTFLERHIAREEQLGLNLEPDFQRAHVWTEAQQVAYVEYILRGGTSGREVYFNHPGWMKGFDGEFVVVDGKQRIQAVRRFLRSEIPAFGYLCNQYEDDPDMLTASFSWHIATLATRREVLDWYIHFNSGGSIHTQEELARVRELLEKEINNE